MSTIPPGAQQQPLRISVDALWSGGQPQLASDDSPLSSTSFPPHCASGSMPSTSKSHWAMCRVLCMFDFHSADPDQLSFTRGDVLIVVKQELSGWWAAMRSEGDRIGWIPRSFVEPLFGWKVDGVQIPSPVSHGEQHIPQTSDDPQEFGAYPDPEGYEPWVPVHENVKVPCLGIFTPTDLVHPHDFYTTGPQSITRSLFQSK